MPQKKVLFACNICGKSYEDERDAIRCERSHLVPTKIVDHYFNRNEKDVSYPESIVVKLNSPDGKEREIRYYSTKPIEYDS